MSPDTVWCHQPTLDDFPDFVSIPVRVARNAKAWPDKIAVMCEGRTRTWHQFDQRIDKITHSLATMGVGHGDKIAILATNSIEYLETFMAGLRAGACVVPLSTMAAADALAKMLRRLRCQGPVFVGPVPQPGRALRGSAHQADRRRAHRL